MQKQKIAAVISSFSVVLFVMIAVYSFYEPIRDYFATERHVTRQMHVLEKTCHFENDQDAYRAAVTSKDIGFCECVKDRNEKKDCKKDTLNIILYDRAMTQLDEELCKKIENAIQESACEKNVQQVVGELKKDNPQKLAEIYALAHNAKAIEQFEEIVSSDPDNILALLSLSLAYAERGLREKEHGRDHLEYVQKSLAMIERAKREDSNNSEVYRAQGYVNEIKPDYDAALEAYSLSIKLDSQNVLAYAGRGHLYRILGDSEQAIEDFMKAESIDIDRNHVFVYTNLCNLKYMEEDRVSAKHYCNIVVNREGADPVFLSEVYQILAMIHAEEQEFVHAKNTLLLAKTAHSFDSDIYVTFAKVSYLEGMFKESEQYALTALGMTPLKSTVSLVQAQALYGQKKYSEAIVAGKEGLDLVDEDVSLLVMMKKSVRNDLYNVISQSYGALGNVQKQKEYQEKIK